MSFIMSIIEYLYFFIFFITPILLVISCLSLFFIKSQKSFYNFFVVMANILLIIWGFLLLVMYIYPIGDRIFGYALEILFASSASLILALGIIIKLLFDLKKKEYTDTFAYYIFCNTHKILVSLFKNLFLFFIIFQIFLIYSASQAYDKAKEMKAAGIQDKSFSDFYSPTIKRISISAGMPPRQYRWSYHKGKYVFEIDQYQKKVFLLGSENNEDLKFYAYSHGKDYLLSIPKKFKPKPNDDIYFEIPSEIDFGKYFITEYDGIRVVLSKDKFYLDGKSLEKYEDKFGLMQEKVELFNYDSEIQKYAKNEYLRYSLKDKLIVTCKIASNYCEMKLFNERFYYKFYIHRKDIDKWSEIEEELPKLFEPFVLDVKEYDPKVVY